MSEILVTFSAIQGAQSDVASTAGNMNQQLGDLKQFLAPMVSTWTGAASEGYQAKQAQWDSASQDLNQVLSQISSALGNAAQDFQHAESSNASVWS